MSKAIISQKLLDRLKLISKGNNPERLEAFKALIFLSRLKKRDDFEKIELSLMKTGG